MWHHSLSGSSCPYSFWQSVPIQAISCLLFHGRQYQRLWWSPGRLHPEPFLSTWWVTWSWMGDQVGQLDLPFLNLCWLGLILWLSCMCLVITFSMISSITPLGMHLSLGWHLSMTDTFYRHDTADSTLHLCPNLLLCWYDAFASWHNVCLLKTVAQ